MQAYQILNYDYFESFYFNYSDVKKMWILHMWALEYCLQIIVGLEVITQYLIPRLF